jgi:hypothetical protein
MRIPPAAPRKHTNTSLSLPAGIGRSTAALHLQIFSQLLLCNRPTIFYELNNPQLVTFKPITISYTVFVLNFCFLTKINSVTIINAILSTVDKIVFTKKYQKLPNCQASNKNNQPLCNKQSTLIKMA